MRVRVVKSSLIQLTLKIAQFYQLLTVSQLLDSLREFSCISKLIRPILIVNFLDEKIYFPQVDT